MKTGRVGGVSRDLGRLFEGQSVAGLGEVQLLERFVERRDEPAFAALVARHGPMVLGVCRKFLANPLDVEDAFQATFLVLVRRAGSLRDRDRPGPLVVRRGPEGGKPRPGRQRETSSEGTPGAEELALVIGPDESRRELGRALIEEIDRLPGALREPTLLCCVEGLSYDEAATRLRSTSPAIRGRLSRAREKLRDRLTRRGFAPSVAVLGALLSAEAASAAVPSTLLKVTTIQALKTGMIPVAVEALAGGVIRTMIVTKSKILAASLVACGVASTSLGVFGQSGPAQEPAQTREADRLGQVEQKLDRVLKALEGPSRPTTVNAPLAPTSLDDTQTKRIRRVTPTSPPQSRRSRRSRRSPRLPATRSPKWRSERTGSSMVGRCSSHPMTW